MSETLETTKLAMRQVDPRKPMNAMSGFTIAWHDSAKNVPAELWTICFPPPLEGLWWYETLERSGLEDQFQFLYAVIKHNEVPVGIAPAFMMNVPMDILAPPLLATLLKWGAFVLPQLGYQRTLFVGSPCAEEGTVGLCPGFELASVAELLQQELIRKARELRASMLVWKDFAERDDLALGALAASAGLVRITSFPGTRMSCRGFAQFDDYLRILTSQQRHNLKKKLRRSCSRLSLSVTVIQYPDRSLLQEIFPLFWQTYERGRTKFERLNPAFFEEIATKPQSYFIILRDEASARIAAFMLCFCLGSRVVNKFLGIDYSYPKDSFLYFRLSEELLRWAIQMKANEVQSGQTGYRPKLDLGHRLVPLTNYCKHTNPLVHRLIAMIAKRINWSTLDSDLKEFLNAFPDADQSHGPPPPPSGPYK